MKKIINIAWAVIILLYNWLSAIYWTPGPDSSNLIKTEKAVPSNPENNANIRYNVPMSFALLDRNQRSHQRDMFDSCVSVSWLLFVLNVLRKGVT
jgi:predicted secreted protein